MKTILFLLLLSAPVMAQTCPSDRSLVLLNPNLVGHTTLKCAKDLTEPENKDPEIVASQAGLAFCEAYYGLPDRFYKIDVTCNTILNFGFPDFGYSFQQIVPSDRPIPAGEEWTAVGESDGKTVVWGRYRVQGR